MKPVCVWETHVIRKENVYKKILEWFFFIYIFFRFLLAFIIQSVVHRVLLGGGGAHNGGVVSIFFHSERTSRLEVKSTVQGQDHSSMYQQVDDDVTCYAACTRVISLKKMLNNFKFTFEFLHRRREELIVCIIFPGQ